MDQSDKHCLIVLKPSGKNITEPIKRKRKETTMPLPIFVLSAPEDLTRAEQIIHGCEALGYQTRPRSQSLQFHEIISPTSQEQMIVGSAVCILLWSQAAAQSEEVERFLLFAQRLQKNIIVLTLDAAPLPTTLVAVKMIAIQHPCDHCMEQISSFLLPPASQDALQSLAERASHEYIRERKAAIEQAASMLQHNEQREAVLALLEHLAQHDTITSVRDKAQEVLNAYTPSPSQPSPQPSQIVESRSIFGVRCKNGHISCFDKRYVCKVTYPVPRGLTQRAGKELDELILSCTTCGEAIVARVDCEGYK
jgi:hypothetical protein